jgi:hypothetical protein
MALNKAYKYLDMRSKTEEFDNILLDNSYKHEKQYLVQGEYTIQYLGEGTWKTICKNNVLEKYGLDQS